MAGHQFSVNLPVKTVAKVTKELAAESQYRVDETDLFHFQLLKGSFAVSLIAGAFITYCNFAVELEYDEQGGTRFTLNRNIPWWTGLIGVSRVKTAAKKLADEIAEELEDSGGIVTNREDFK